VPEISRFFGISIRMNYREHGPPHFHAWYGSDEITVEIADGRTRGQMPDRAARLVLEWWKLHREELFDNWERARQQQPLHSIEPLK
jgi:hypothetical protein